MSPLSLTFGDQFNFEISWLEGFHASFPVVFYIERCTVANVAQSDTFDIVKDGCNSDLVETIRHTESYSIDNIQLSFKSFSFISTQGQFDLTLSCSVGFCLTIDRDSNLCGIDTNSCPTNYSP